MIEWYDVCTSFINKEKSLIETEKLLTSFDLRTMSSIWLEDIDNGLISKILYSFNEIDFVGNIASIERFEQFLSSNSSKNINSVLISSLESEQQLNEIIKILKSWYGFGSLEKIAFSTKFFQDHHLEKLFENRNFPFLKTLGLVSCNITAEGVLFLVEKVTMQKLENLYISNNTNIGNDGWKYITYWDHLSKLQELFINGTGQINNDTMIELKNKCSYHDIYLYFSTI